MIKTLKLVAVLLTLLLLILVFYGIAQGIFYSPSFWLLYLLVLIADFLIIAFLKKAQ